MNIKRTIQATFWRAIMAVGLGVLAIVGWVFHVQTTQAALDVPQILVYQGRLTDDDRITVDDASYSMKFAIYDASSGGNCLWSAGDTDATTSTIDCSSNTPDGSISVTVTDGIFTVLLGDTSDSQNALPDTLFDDNATLFLGVTIASDSEMTPRRRIGSAAFALQAGDADLLDSLDTDNDGCTTACVPVTDSNGNLVLTGDPQGSSVSDGTLYINPAAAASDEILFGISDNGTSRFHIDKEGDFYFDGHGAVGDASSVSAEDVLRVFEDYGDAVTRRGVNTVMYLSGPLNAGGNFTGNRTHLEVESGAGNDVETATAFKAELDHDGSGTSDSFRGLDVALVGSAGTVTDAFGVDVTISTDGGTITAARAVRGEVQHTSGTIPTAYGGQFSTTGTIATSYGVVGEAQATATTNYGGYFKAAGGTTDIAVYTDEGMVLIDGDATPETSFDLAGANGTLHVENGIETDGALRVDGTVGVAMSRNTNLSIYTGAAFSGTEAGADTAGIVLNTSSTAVGSGGSEYRYIGVKNVQTYSGTGTDTEVYGDRHVLYIEGSVDQATGVFADVGTRSTAASVPLYGGVFKAGNIASSSTVSAAYGVFGEAYETDGTVTTGYGGYFKSTNAGTNYAIYTAEGLVHIEGDATATTPNTATTDGELYVLGDIENDGDIDSNGHLALVGDTPSSTSIIAATETFDAASEHRGVDIDLTVESAQTHSGGYFNVGINGALNSGGRVNGVSSIVDVDADSGAANDTQEINQYLGSTNYLGTGLTDDINGVKTVTKLSSTGDATNVYGVQAHVLTENAGAAITDAYGGFFNVNETSGAISKGYGVYAKSTGATTNYAIYGGSGQLWIEGDDTPTTATFNDVATGTTGTVFIQGDTEIFDGSLCVGDGGTGAASPGGNCANATGTDGVIYSVNTSVTQHDLAEMFPSKQFLTAGEIVSVSPETYEHVERTVGDEVIIGAISTAPGLTLGWETEEDGYYPVALTGRAPVKVNDEGGPIAIGDRIAQSSVAGVGMKANGASEIVGIAMEAFDGNGNGAVMTFIQPHFWNGVDEASIAEEEPEPEVDPSQVLAIEANTMSNIASLTGYEWSIDVNGTFTTESAYRVMIRGLDNRDTVTYSTLSTREFITLAGTTKIEGRKADIEFRRIDPAFANVIQPGAPIVVTATMSNGSGSVSVREKSTNGFEIWRDGGDGDEVDWIVMAYRIGTSEDAYAEPEVEETSEEVETEVIEEETTEEAETSEETEESAEEETTDEEVVDETETTEEETEEPAVEEPTEEETAEEVEETTEVVEETTEPTEEEVVEESSTSEEPSTEPESASEPETEEVVEE